MALVGDVIGDPYEIRQLGLIFKFYLFLAVYLPARNPGLIFLICKIRRIPMSQDYQD
jgi:hypothetical protein